MPSVTIMKALGWGNPGPAGSEKERRWKLKNLVRLNVNGVDSVWVHKAIASQMKALALILNAHGARLGKVRDDWGFANRDIRGFRGIKSYHAWALAVDWDATEHPLGARRTTFPIAVTRAACRKLGFRWGFDYEGRPDPMHFEFIKSRVRAAYYRHKLRRVNKKTRRLAAMADMPVKEFIRKVNNYAD